MNPATTNSQTLSPPDEDGRSDSRSNIFVAAIISSAQFTGPVRIRNISRQGALIEGGALPSQGSRVRVSRGSLRASGIIAWSKANRAGIRFESVVAVADWLPRGPRTQQQNIDEIVYAHKAGMTISAEPAVTPTDLQHELGQLEQMLRRAAEDFARDGLVCERHLDSVQLLDVAAEKLARLAKKL